MKVCSGCKKEKEFSEFNIARGFKDGHVYRCKACNKTYSKNRYADKKEHINAVNKSWRDKNLEYKRELDSSWKKNNKDRVCYYSAKRRANQLRSSPKWLETEDVGSLYKEASERGLHVDHIVPLKNDLVCGLHCLDNLQLLTPSENTSKGNKFNIG